jgi:hypothetical protein
MNSTNLNEGPEIYQFPNCNGCKYLITRGECHKLKKEVTLYTNSNLIKPLDDCPFLKQNKLNFYEIEVKKLKEELSLKLKTELTSIFPEYWEYEDYLFKKTDLEISAAFKISHIDYGQLIDFQKYLPDYRLSFDACTSDKILVRVFKKMECF